MWPNKVEPFHSWWYSRDLDDKLVWPHEWNHAFILGIETILAPLYVTTPTVQKELPKMYITSLHGLEQ